MKKFRLVLALLLIFSIALPLSAQETAVKGLYHYTLDNGLELFVMENSSAPLAYIEIAVRGGGIGQTTETAGLFHLYEHMMFKGNSLYPTAASVQRAINDLGCASWNGTTGAEYVNYFFTVPSDRLEDGMRFWSAAIRDPLMDPSELENEKLVVLSEIEGDLNDPSQIMYSARSNMMFPRYPERLDPGGTPELVRTCTIEKIMDIKNRFYVPNNAALFIGGDVNHADVKKLADRIFGDWKRAADPWAGEREYQDPEPFLSPRFAVMPYDQLPEYIAQVNVMYRGPDTALDPDSTYAADLWGTIIGNPAGSFAATLVGNEEFMIPNAGYVSGSYYTQRETGMINFTGIMLQPSISMAQRAKDFQQVIAEEIVTPLANNPEQFTEEDFANAKRSIEDGEILNAETAKGLLSSLRFWWAATSSDYYFTYSDRVKAATGQDIADFATTYLLDKNPLTIVLVNPAVYEAQKKDFDALGFELISADNAFWWK